MWKFIFIEKILITSYLKTDKIVDKLNFFWNIMHHYVTQTPWILTDIILVTSLDLIFIHWKNTVSTFTKNNSFSRVTFFFLEIETAAAEKGRHFRKQFTFAFTKNKWPPGQDRHPVFDRRYDVLFWLRTDATSATHQSCR